MNQRNEAFAEVEALTRTVDKLDERLDQIDRLAGRSSNAATSILKVNAGGAGMWVAVSLSLLAAALMLGINIGLAVMVTNHDRKIERLQDYLQVVYTHAPHLKEIADAEAKNEESN